MKEGSITRAASKVEGGGGDYTLQHWTPAVPMTEPTGCCFKVSIRRARDVSSPGTHRLINMTALDMHYANAKNAAKIMKQHLALKLAFVLNPKLLTQVSRGSPDD
jgi:hypothetical protein